MAQPVVTRTLFIMLDNGQWQVFVEGLHEPAAVFAGVDEAAQALNVRMLATAMTEGNMGAVAEAAPDIFYNVAPGDEADALAELMFSDTTALSYAGETIFTAAVEEFLEDCLGEAGLELFAFLI